MFKNKNINTVDLRIGENLRKIRKKHHMSQEELAEKVGLTFQQIQKYETGLNRISCSKLWEFANIFKTPVSYFFIGLEKYTVDTNNDDHTLSEVISQYHFKGMGDYATFSEDGDLNEYSGDMLLDSEIMDYISEVDNQDVKISLLNLVKALQKSN